jgi:hypothetical protein
MKKGTNLQTGIGAVISVFLISGAPTVLAFNPPALTTVLLHPAVSFSDAEIQHALDQLPAEGGTVMLGPGLYAIHRPLCLSRSDQTLRGSGEATVLRLTDEADCPVVILGPTIANPVRGVHDLRLADLVIDGNRHHQVREQWMDPANTSGIQNNGIMIQDVSNSVVEEVVAAHCRSGGLVTANGTRRLTVSGFTAFDNQFDGLACYRTEDSVFTNLFLHDNQAAGISLDLNFDHNLISGSTLAGNDLGIFMRCSCNNQFQNITISQSRHDGVFMAQWDWSAIADGLTRPQTQCEGNHFASLKISNCGGEAFRVHDASCINNTIEDGIFSDNLGGDLAPGGTGVVHARD